MHFSPNPLNQYIGNAVCQYYPDMEQYLMTHERPRGEEYGKWSFDMIKDEKVIKRQLFMGDFSSAVSAVCVSALEEEADSLVLVDNVYPIMKES